MSNIIDKLVSAGHYTRPESSPLSELTEDYMVKEFSFLPLNGLGRELVSTIHARSSRAAEAYLQNNPDYS